MKPALKVFVFPLAVLLLGSGVAMALVKSKPKADRAAPPRAALAVEVVVAEPQPARPLIQSTGTVQPARKVTLSAEVGGRIVEVSEEAVPGGRVRKGAVLARIDPRDYQLAVQQEEARVRQAQVELELERGRQGVAEREWKLLREGSPEGAALALRKPQLQAAEGALRAAESGLERAKLALERTTLRAPFNAVIAEETLEIGRVVGAGAAVATLIGTDSLWVMASARMEDLPLLDVPQSGAERGSTARVVQRVGAERAVEREGRVLRLQGELDPTTRRAGLLIGVDEPFGSGLPLLPGAFVEVILSGREVPGVIPVPRAALVDGGAVWLVDAEDRLRRREVRIGWRDAETAFVTGGLQPGERLVVSPLAVPVEGSAVRPIPRQAQVALPAVIEAQGTP
jgi:RND family efflux transporter MFP subunit